MEIGLMIRWGKMVPGREAQALEMFDEATKYFADRKAAGEITSFEPYMLAAGDLEEETGFFILKAQAPDMFRLMEDEAFLRLQQKGYLLVEHLRVDMLTVGEGIALQLERASKVRAELGV
jgi:hypothetical protein